MRLYGDLRAGGHPRTVGVFQDETRKGVATLVVDPRLLPQQHRPLLQVQPGLEGSPGDYVVFDFLEFLPEDNRTKNARSKPQPGQRNIECVTLMPNIPQPFKMRDWHALACACDHTAFNFRTMQPVDNGKWKEPDAAAARMNAELDRKYDVHKFINWCFGISDCRGGWEVIATNWHGYDCHGLLGSIIRPTVPYCSFSHRPAAEKPDRAARPS